eukprot:1982488-Alexandrium_andersonii.AAC.1
MALHAASTNDLRNSRSPSGHTCLGPAQVGQPPLGFAGGIGGPSLRPPARHRQSLRLQQLVRQKEPQES